MRNNNTQLTLLINSDKMGDKNAIQYMQAIPGVYMEIIDLATEKITENELASLIEKMAISIEDLLDPDYDDHISVHTEGLRLMDRQSLLSLMAEDTKLIATPIVIQGENAFLLEKGDDRVREQLVFEMASRALTSGFGNIG